MPSAECAAQHSERPASAAGVTSAPPESWRPGRPMLRERGPAQAEPGVCRPPGAWADLPMQAARPAPRSPANRGRDLVYLPHTVFPTRFQAGHSQEAPEPFQSPSPQKMFEKVWSNRAVPPWRKATPGLQTRCPEEGGSAGGAAPRGALPCPPGCAPASEGPAQPLGTRVRPRRPEQHRQGRRGTGRRSRGAIPGLGLGRGHIL